MINDDATTTMPRDGYLVFPDWAALEAWSVGRLLDHNVWGIDVLERSYLFAPSDAPCETRYYRSTKGDPRLAELVVTVSEQRQSWMPVPEYGYLIDQFRRVAKEQLRSSGKAFEDGAAWSDYSTWSARGVTLQELVHWHDFVLAAWEDWYIGWRASRIMQSKQEVAND